MQIDVNIHAASFDRTADVEEYDTLPSAEPLQLTGEFTFVYTYPLSRPATFVRELTPEMSALDLLDFGKADYERIYAEEDAAFGDPGHISGMLNRARSEGPHGIWGHGFSDLFFEGITIEGRKIEFEMGS